MSEAIAVIDYGMGNIRSVQKALESSGARTKVTSCPADIEKCAKIVFPGVGAFGDAMRELKRRGLDLAIKRAVGEGKPFLGLCLGLQLLFEKSEEAPGVKGLGLLSGEVRRFRLRKSGLKVPHMGWNSINVKCKKQNAKFKRRKAEAGILDGVKDGSYVYFVHSYYVKPRDKSVVLTTTEYGSEFVSGICSGNTYALQFHPEKSQATGLKILSNFIKSI
jgi:glutamine amidotransferase